MLALLAVHGKMESLLLPLDHSDAGERRVADAPVFHRAYHLAFSAAVTFFGIYDKLLSHETLPLNVQYREQLCHQYNRVKAVCQIKNGVFINL
jgi:hypothetical protein